jgi:hypothetical protein
MTDTTEKNAASEKAEKEAKASSCGCGCGGFAPVKERK